MGESLGAVQDGRYRLAFGWLAEYQVGQAVTIVYDAEDPRKHLLDIDDVRRADARESRLAGRRSESSPRFRPGGPRAFLRPWIRS